MRVKRWVLGMVCLSIIVFVNGCSKSETSSTLDTSQSKYSSQYPLDTDKTLEFWIDVPANQDYKSFRDQPFFIELMKETGVNLEMTFAAAGQGGEVFNLMMASGDLPDILGFNWLGVPGGPEKYITEKYILPLNDIFQAYAPNISAYLEENQDVARMIRSDAGNYYAFPFVRETDILTTYIGPVARNDLLSELGLALPETIDEWETVLYALKDAGIESPLCTTGDQLRLLSSAFGAWGDYYVQDGAVVYGPAQPEYRKFLETFSRWYADGLIEKDIASVDNNIINSKMSSGKGGLSMGSGGNIGSWTAAGKNLDSNYSLAALKYPTLQKGATSEFGYKENRYGGAGSCAITSKCEDVELAARFLDYGYSEKGHMLFNFGIEGESYIMQDGYPTYTREMYEYKSGDLGAGISRYIWSIGAAPCIQDQRMYDQRMQTETQRTAIRTWSETNMASHLMPPVLPTSEEASEISQLSASITTYANEMYYNFLFGQESLDTFDAYVAQLESMGLSRLIELKQAALDRYYQR